MVQEPAAPQVFDNALPTPGLQAHTVISRNARHLPYYRQEQINLRSGVHTPRSTLAAWSGQTGAQPTPPPSSKHPPRSPWTRCSAIGQLISRCHAETLTGNLP